MKGNLPAECDFFFRTGKGYFLSLQAAVEFFTSPRKNVSSRFRSTDQNLSTHVDRHWLCEKNEEDYGDASVQMISGHAVEA
jgi:hypothetical protein